jgi:hypothetical protein
MATRNMSTGDRLFRLLAGIAILGLYGALEPPLKYFTLIGLIPFGTALTGFCPLYALLGWDHAHPHAGERPS